MIIYIEKYTTNYNKPISPLQSPSGSNYNKKNDFYNNNNNNTSATAAGSVTPPYYSGMARDLQRPLMKDNYTDDSYHDDFYKTPYYQSKSSSNMDLPRKNSTSPAPSSPTSYR
jgi:hypothetical protein